MAHREAGTYCGMCALFLKSGRPKWRVGGKWYHHHCARYLPEPPPATVCRAGSCLNSTSVSYAEDGEFEIHPMCWLHRRPERVRRGVGLAGDLLRRAEELALEMTEEEWLRAKGMHPSGSVVDGT